MEPRVINNIPTEYHKLLVETIFNHSFPWYLHKRTVNPKGEENIYASFNNDHTKESPQFSHTFFKNDNPNSDYYNLIEDMFRHLDGVVVKNIIRIKANLIVKDSEFPEGFYNTPHSDTVIEGNFKSFLYYLNDSDGDTVIFKERLSHNWKDNLNDLTLLERHTPKAGTGILFDSNQLHASSPPRVTDHRAVINFVFEV